MENKNLEYTLKLMDSIQEDDQEKELRLRIKSLIKQSDYKPLERKKSFCNYLVKESDEKCRVLIQGWDHKRSHHYAETCYGYAEVKQGKLEEFCKRFDFWNRKMLNNTIPMPGILIGLGTGTSGGVLADKVYYALKGMPQPEMLTEISLVLGLLGFMVGAMIGGLTYNVIQSQKNERKLKNCVYYLTTEEKKALTKAFG